MPEPLVLDMDRLFVTRREKFFEAVLGPPSATSVESST